MLTGSLLTAVLLSSSSSLSSFLFLSCVYLQEEIQGPDGQPGYQHVLKLAKALVEARSLQGLSDKRVDRLIVLWQRLPESDKQRVVYPPRHRERQRRGSTPPVSNGKTKLIYIFLINN